MRLGYVLIESCRQDAWQRFAKEGLGLHVEAARDGVLAVRVDDRQRRIVVRPARPRMWWRRAGRWTMVMRSVWRSPACAPWA
jgi:hypothetical protein